MPSLPKLIPSLRRVLATAAVALVLAAAPLCAAAQQPAPPTTHEFTNPVLWEDLADIDILRVGDTFFYSASNMHYSPGAPILRSYDLVHWEFIGHSVPVLDFGPQYDMQGGHAYVRGTWASFLGYRPANKTFYWGGCIGFAKTHIYTAQDPAGPWQKHAILDQCYYDAGLLVDDDNTMYVAYGNTKISVAQLSPDATHQVKAQQVFTTPSDIGVLEGSRFYKIHGDYFIFTTRPADGEYVLRSTTGPFGPYTLHKLLRGTTGPVAAGGVPHQGGIVQTPNGDWYYMAFQDAYPGGRIPVLAPLHWDAEGWPFLDLKDNHWDANYPLPNIAGPPHPVRPLIGTDTFRTSTLRPEWEWNHNPDNTHWSAGKGLHLQTATVTDDLYAARNTLTHRILGPVSTATVELNLKQMHDGDCTGLAMLRNASAWIGVRRDGKAFRLVQQDGLTMDRHWSTTSTGTEAASVPLKRPRIWLRATADIHPGPGRTASFFYSLDGKSFLPFGRPFVLDASWPFFMGYRFGLFSFATKATGGAVTVRSFDLQAP